MDKYLKRLRAFQRILNCNHKLWTTVAFLHCCNLIWGLANNNYSLYFLQFLTISGNLHLCYMKYLRAFQRILNCNIRIYEHIWYENYEWFYVTEMRKNKSSSFCWQPLLSSVFDYQWQFTFVLYFHSLLYCTVLLYIVEPLRKLTETSFFCWRSHKYELLPCPNLLNI
jgi:hypothetical protein